MALSFTQADIDAIDSAIARGVSEVQYANGQKVRFPSMDDMIKARNLMVKEVSKAAAAAAGRRSGYSLATFD
jgi:hypothetical protein